MYLYPTKTRETGGQRVLGRLWQEMEKQKVLEELLLEELLLDELLLEEHHAEVPELHHREHRNLHLLY